MKIKQSLVTNSSSTSFMLASDFECAFRSDKIKEVIEHIQNSPFLSTFSIMHSNKYYIEMEKLIPLDDSSDNREPLLFSNDIDFHNTKYSCISVKVYIRFGNIQEHDSIVISIFIENPRSIEKKDKTNKVISLMIAKEIKKVAQCKLKTKAFFHQYIRDYWGDGWNGGDPMGIYSNTMEAKKNETFTKTLYLVG